MDYGHEAGTERDEGGSREWKTSASQNCVSDGVSPKFRTSVFVLSFNYVLYRSGFSINLKTNQVCSCDPQNAQRGKGGLVTVDDTFSANKRYS